MNESLEKGIAVDLHMSVPEMLHVTSDCILWNAIITGVSTLDMIFEEV